MTHILLSIRGNRRVLRLHVSATVHNHRVDFYGRHAWGGNPIATARIFGGGAGWKKWSIIPTLPFRPFVVGELWLMRFSCYLLLLDRHCHPRRGWAHVLPPRVLVTIAD